MAAGNGGQKMSQYSWFTVYDENGEEYGNLVESQNIQEIELYLSPVVE